MQFINGKRMVLLAAAVMLLSATAPAIAQDAESPDQPITISRQGELFNITITETSPAEDVLAELADAIGAELEGAEDAGDVGPLTLVRVSLNQALREILQKQSFAMKYDEGSNDPSVIRVSVSRVAAADAGEGAADPPADVAGNDLQQAALALFNGKKPPEGLGKAGGLAALFGANPRLKNARECAELLKRPENRGKKSEALVTAEGEPCPAGVMNFGP